MHTSSGERYLVEDETKLVGVQCPLWWVGIAVDQPRSQTCHRAVVDDVAVLQREQKGDVNS